MNNIVFGRYTNYDTPIHKIEPRVKLLMLVLLISMIFFQFSVWSTNILFSIILLIFLFLVLILSKASIKSLLKSIGSMWFLILFLFIIYILMPNSRYTHPAFSFNNGFTIYYDAFYQCGYIILRLILMISLTMVLTLSTKPIDLTYAFEWYMTPLKLIKVPVHACAMTISLALRLIPTLLEEADRIRKAQASRGMDIENGSFIKKIKSLLSLIIPLLVTSFQRSDELSTAMEARGYDPLEKRTRYKIYKFSLIDLLSLIIVVIFFGLFLTLFILDQSYQPLDIFKDIIKIDIGF
ncbi:MAG: energy-coupling factor transporter transmembrane component T family protein [Bacilli bacterium]